MALKNKIIFHLLFNLCLSYWSFAENTLDKTLITEVASVTPAVPKAVELFTKQNPNNIRFISNDGKYTYYQKRSGELVLSTNYNMVPVMSSEYAAQYTIHGTNARKILLVEHQALYHEQHDLNGLLNIYILPFGTNNLKLVGEGINSKLHLQDSFISYYSPAQKNITLVSIAQILNSNINSNSKEAKIVKKDLIPINSKFDPYFIPEAALFDKDAFLFTDRDEQGKESIVLFSPSDQKKLTLFQEDRPGIKIELCLNENLLYIGRFPYPTVAGGSSIWQIDLKQTKDFSKLAELYKSDKSDYGQFICDQDPNIVYFIKNYSPNNKFNFTNHTEAVALDVKSKEITQLTFLKSVTQIINLDGKIIAPFQDKFFLVKGENFSEKSVFEENLDSLNEKEKEDI